MLGYSHRGNRPPHTCRRGCLPCVCPATSPRLAEVWSETQRPLGPHTWCVSPHRSPSTNPRAGRGACPLTHSHGGTHTPQTRRLDNSPHGPGPDNTGGGPPPRLFPFFGKPPRPRIKNLL